MFDCFVFFRREPAYVCSVFGAYAVAPGKVVVDLDEIVVAKDRGLRLDAAEKVGHAFF